MPRHPIDPHDGQHDVLSAVADLAGAVHTRRAPATDLRAPICCAVAGLRAGGAPPERVVVLIKSALHAGGLAPSGGREDADTRVVAQAITWCIEAFFRV